MLLKIEWLKLRSNRFFWAGMILYWLLTILLLSKFGDFEVFGGNPENSANGANPFGQSFKAAGFYKLPYIWQNTTWLAGFLKFIPAFLICLFMANEFQYRTQRQNVIDGLTRSQFYLSKLSGFFLILALCLIPVFLTIIILSLANNDLSTASLWSQADYMLALFAEYLIFTSFTFLLTILFKRSAVAIIVALSYYYLIELVIGEQMGRPGKYWLPTYSGHVLIEQPFTRLFKVDSFLGITSPTEVPIDHLLRAFLYSFLFLTLGFVLIRKRDL